MYKILKSNLIYTLQNKIILALHIMILLYIDIVSVLYTLKNEGNFSYSQISNSLLVFLFISIFLFMNIPFSSSKYFKSNNYSIFTLSFPVTRKQYVISHYIKLIVFMLVIFFNITIISSITMLITKSTLYFNDIHMLLLTILYTIGLPGSFYIMTFFLTKYFQTINFAFYFCSFYISTILDVEKLNYSNIINILIPVGILIIIVFYIISLITIKNKNFN